jgi:WD40 repeat protein
MHRVLLAALFFMFVFDAGAAAQNSRPAARARFSPAALRRARVLGETAFRHGQEITCISPLPDGRRVLVSARDDLVRLWDLPSGAELRRFCQPKSGAVWNVCLLPGNREFLAATTNDCVTRWDIETCKILKTYPHGDTVFRLAVAADGRRFAAGDAEHLCVLWDLEAGKPIRRFRGHKESVYTLWLSRDGSTLVTGSEDETIRFWDVKTGTEARRVKNNSGTIYTLAGSPDGRRLLVCCSKKGLWQMDAATGKTVWQAPLSDGVTAAAWSPGGAVVAAVCGDKALYVFNATDGKRLRRVALPGRTHWSLAFTVDGEEILCGVDHLVCRFDAGTLKRTFPKPPSPLQYGSVDMLLPVPERRLLVQAGGGAGIRLQHADSGKIEKTLLAGKGVRDMAVSADGRLLLAAVRDGGACLLDIRTEKVLHRFSHEDVTSVAFARNGRLAITGGGGSKAIAWQVEDGRLLRTFSGHQGDLGGLTVSGDGMLLATLSYDRLRIWDLYGGSQLAVIQEESAYSGRCVFVPSGGGSFVLVIDGKAHYWTAPVRRSAAPPEAEIRRLILQLGATAYKQRQRATTKLVEAGRAALPIIKSIESENVEVQRRLRWIMAEIQKRLTSYRKTGSVSLGEGSPEAFAFHPDGRHWAAVSGTDAAAELVIGEVRDNGLKVVRRMQDPNMPHTVAFAGDGTLYVGNRNGTVSVYSAEQPPRSPD